MRGSELLRGAIGVERILQEATAISPHINILFGGFHEITHSPSA